MVLAARGAMQTIRRMPGGMVTVVEPLVAARSVAIDVVVRVGAAHEDAATSGIGHFIEHLLFKGSARWPTPRELALAIEGLGGECDAYTSYEMTVYHVRIAAAHLGHAVEVLGDLLLAPRFNAADVARERRVIVEELRETADMPPELVHTLLNHAMWGEQPLGRDVAGSEASLAQLDLPQIVAHWRAHYVQANTIVSIAGAVDPVEAHAIVERVFGAMPTGAPMPRSPVMPALPGPRVRRQRHAGQQAHVALGFVGLAAADPDLWAWRLVDAALGAGAASRLFQRIREELGLAYTIGSTFDAYDDAGTVVIYGSVAPESLQQCIHEVLDDLRRLRRLGLGADELRAARHQVQGALALALESPWAVASWNAQQLARGIALRPLEHILAEYDAVTDDAIVRVARRVLRDDAMHLAIVGPAGAGRTLGRAVRLGVADA
jgi:predicted Zn-dependent peptidase